MLSATLALASGVLPFEGAFGNPAGCHLYATGERTAGYLLLTPDTFSSEPIGCDFGSLVSASETGFTVEAVCSPGGDRTVRVIERGGRGYGFIAGEGPEVGPLADCSPVNLTLHQSEARL